MGVDQRADRGRADSPFLIETDDRDGVERTVEAVRAIPPPAVGRLAGDGEVGCASGLPDRSGAARTCEQWASPELVRQELTEHEAAAHQGVASSARRVAELYEALRDQESADAWWRKAAELGDGDAIDYVRFILS